jgi:hypothetical protein
MTEDDPDDDAELASYDGVIASKSSQARGGTISHTLVILLAGDEHCIKRRHKYGDQCGIDLPCVHSTPRPSLAACLFKTSHSSLRRRAHADTAAWDMLCAICGIRKLRNLRCPTGVQLSYTHAPGCITPDRGGREPQTRGLPPMRNLLDHEMTVREASPAALHEA